MLTAAYPVFNIHQFPYKYLFLVIYVANKLSGRRIIEQIKELISKKFDENYEKSISKEKKEFSILRNLYQTLLEEEQEIMLFIITKKSNSGLK